MAATAKGLYVDDDEELGPRDFRPVVDLHGRVRDGLHLRALGVLPDCELLAGSTRLYPKVLPVELRDLHSLFQGQRKESGALIESRGYHRPSVMRYTDDPRA
jgi:hypothetical protein